jgi:sterol 3beta-glucosyltransferase
MRISIITIGTLGEVRPYIALGRGLQAAGHQVKLVAFRQFEGLAREYGLDFFALSGDLEEYMKRDWTQRQIERGASLSALGKLPILSETTRLMSDLLRDCLAACEQADAILGQAVASVIAEPVARKLDVAYCAAYIYPLDPTNAFPHSFSLFPLAPGWNWRLKGLYNRITYALSAAIFRLLLHPISKRAQRAVLGLEPARGKSCLPVVYGYSPGLLPKPADWDGHITVCGYWFLDEQRKWHPPAELEAFLRAGPPPIYIGFGSMAGRGAASIIRPLLATLSNLRQRCIVQVQRDQLEETLLSDQVYCLESAPHDWLFPQVSVVIHHGGAGTTATALRAGRPQIIVPFIADQRFWGQLIGVSGLGPAPLQRKKMTPERIQTALAIATSEATLSQARIISECLQREDGVALAVEALNRYLQGQRQRNAVA